MATESKVIRTKRDAQILYSDSGALHSYTVAYEPGDFTYSVPAETTNVFLDRGKINDDDGYPSVRYGDEQPMTFGHSAYWRDLGDTSVEKTYATLPDLLNRYEGGYVATNWVSTLSGRSDAFAVNCTLTIDGAAFGEADKSLIFPHAAIRGGGTEGDPSTQNVTGTSYAARPTLI